MISRAHNTIFNAENNMKTVVAVVGFFNLKSLEFYMRFELLNKNVNV